MKDSKALYKKNSKRPVDSLHREAFKRLERKI